MDTKPDYKPSVCTTRTWGSQSQWLLGGLVVVAVNVFVLTSVIGSLRWYGQNPLESTKSSAPGLVREQQASLEEEATSQFSYDMINNPESISYMVLPRHGTIRKNAPQVPMSVVLPCHVKHWYYIPRVLHSVANQTMIPSETILLLLVEEGKAQEYEHSQFDFVKGTGVPNLRVFIRAGSSYPGQSRVFGASQARNDIVSFFDCDDYMHPQRIEIEHKLFKAWPEMDANIHCLLATVEGELDFRIKDLASREYTDEEIYNSTPYTYTELQEDTMLSQETLGLPPWDINNRSTEPDWPGQPVWFVGRGSMNIHTTMQPHKGWLTVKRSVLEEIPYPTEMVVGEDSLYNFRLLRSNKNWQLIQLGLGLYIGEKQVMEKLRRVKPAIY